MKKKIALFLLAVMLTMTLAACDEEKNKGKDRDDDDDNGIFHTSTTEYTSQESQTEFSDVSSTDSGTIKSYTDFIQAHPHDDEYFSTDEDDYCYTKTSCYPASADEIFNRCMTYNLVTYDNFGVVTSSKYKIVFENAADAQTAYDFYQQLMHMPLYSEGFMLFDNVVYFYDASHSPSSAVSYSTKWQLFAVFDEYEQATFTEIEKSEDLRYYNYSGNEYYLSKPLLQEDYDKLDAYYAVAEPMTGYHFSVDDFTNISVDGSRGYGYEEYEYSVRIDEDNSFYGSLSDSFYDMVFDDKSITLFWEETEYDENYNYVPTGRTAVIRLEKLDDSIQVDATMYGERVTRDTAATAPSEWQKQVFIPLG